jgi:hypothetical protein
MKQGLKVVGEDMHQLLGCRGRRPAFQAPLEGERCYENQQVAATDRPKRLSWDKIVSKAPIEVRLLKVYSRRDAGTSYSTAGFEQS